MIFKSKILRNENISQNYFKLALRLPEDSVQPIPGQFYNIRCSETTDPLLRRPFSLHRLIQDQNLLHIEILYRVIGKGTDWLSKRKKEEILDVVGPLGNGFLMEEDPENILLIARGIGIAPLYGLGEESLKKNKKKKIFLLIGARLKERIFYEEECKKIGEVFLYTDDGSKGFHGRAPDLLLHLLKHKKLPQDLLLYACGPNLMLKELSEISNRFGLHGRVALETHMACGFGVCLSCVCPLKGGSIKRNQQWGKPSLLWSEDRSRAYSLICQDGPIYDIQEVDWDEWIT
jgi:dihydroorotate dehydrogenase electron transfer subunit